MSLLAEARTLLALARGTAGAGTHAERMQRFYAPQAAHYDRFRERLLQGRAELVGLLAPPPGSLVVELGGGTGRNAEFFGAALGGLEALEIVDVCPALLAEAARRARRLPRLRVVEADACTYRPSRPADCVYFSYSLTMMPDPRAALANAVAMLRPGGTLGIVDFHVPEGAGLFDRLFWPHWFARDSVNLSAEHLRAARGLVTATTVRERRARVPYLAGLTVPYFVLVGRKREAG